MPLADVRDNPAHLKLLEEWLRSYGPKSCSTRAAGFVPELQSAGAARARDA